MAELQRLGWGINSTTNGHEFDAYVGSPTLTTSNPRTGTYAGLITGLVSGTKKYFQYIYASSNIGVVFPAFYVCFTTLPSAENRFAELAESGGVVGQAYLTVDNSGTIRLYDATGQITGTTTVTTGTQYYEFEVNLNNTGGIGASTVEARVNNTVFATASNRTLSVGSASLVMGANLNGEAQTTGSWQFADMAVSTSSYPGSYKNETLFPIAAGDSAQWTVGGSSPAATNWQSVNQNPPDDAVTLVSSTTLNQTDLYKFGTTGTVAGDTINYVAVNSRHANNIATANMSYELQLEKVSSGTLLASTAIQLSSGTWRNNATNAATTPRTPMIITATDPDGGAWTGGATGTVGTLQAGPKITNDNSTSTIQVTLMFIVVSYTPAVNANVTQVAGAVTASGGTQTLATSNFATVSQLAGSVTAVGGTQVIMAGSGSTNASITQLAASVIASGGTQTLATVNNASIAQIAANVTATGGTQTLATVNNVAISQLAATVTAAGGTQVITTQNFVSIAQLAGTVTAAGGTQVAGSQISASVTQVAATVTATGGTQAVATVNNVTVTQIAGSVTASGGTQTLAISNLVAIAQIAANVTATGGTQAVSITGGAVNVSVTQVAGSVLATGGTQAPQALIIYPFVEGKVVTNGTGVATTPAFTNAFVAGQLVVVNIIYDGGVTGLTTSVVDSKGNTYHQVGSFALADSATIAIDAWYAVITTGGAAPTVTVNFNSAATNVNVVVQYFNGFTGTPTLDKAKSQFNTSSTTVTSGASAATIVATELVVGLAGHAATVSAFSLGSGYTNLTQSSVANMQAAMESKMVYATGAQTATFTIAAARVNMGGVLTFYDFSSAPSASITQVAATVTAAGGTQSVATVQNISITQVAGSVTATGGTQATVAKQNASVTQVAGSVMASGGTQVITTVQNISVTQVAGAVTASGGTQTIATQNFVTISQVAGSVVATGGTQAVKTQVSVTQVAANVVATGGTQAIATVRNASVTQVAATVTATGGTQVISAGLNANVTQIAGTVTATGGTQAVNSVQKVAITQVHGSVIATGGTQVAISARNVSITQIAATVTAAGGTQTVATFNNIRISQIAATVTARGGTQRVSTPGLRYWNGSAWTPRHVKVWNGSAWVVKPLKKYTGSAWVVLSN